MSEVRDANRLPDEVESRVLDALDLETEAVEAAIELVCTKFPAHADAIRRRYAYARELARDLDDSDDFAAPPADLRGERIGNYRVLEKIGHGGMGTVYLAQQEQPVERRVALKVIRPDMATGAMLRRFEREHRMLARMNHDHIARVYDAGRTAAGQPFYAMEFVTGLPLREYCDRNELGLRARIALFCGVCRGVQHAHQKGVIHRDLKPANVLVTGDGDDATPKIIDFGLVRPIELDGEPALSLHTLQGQIVGTPEYMSPEQVDPDAADIDTRTDIYALGVMLYELLTGELPFASSDLRKRGLSELRRVVCEVEPRRPSDRATTSRLQSQLRHDLDWIVLKAIHKDRDERYDSAAALAADLQRYLDHEPVLAGPPSTSYRVRKFVRRYRGQVLAVAAVLVTALTGGVIAVQNGLAALAEGRRAAARQAEFDMLAYLVRLEQAEEAQERIHPPWPDRADELERWLRDHADPLRAALPAMRATLATIVGRALPPTPAELDADRRSHPRYAELEHLRLRQQAVRRAHDVLNGNGIVELPELGEDIRAMSAEQQLRLASRYIGQYEGASGRERFALALAKLAESRLREPSLARKQVAWASFLCGLDTEAVKWMHRAIADAPPHLEQHLEAELGKLQDMCRQNAGGAHARVLEQIGREITALEAEIAADRVLRFGREADSHLYRSLQRSVRGIEELERVVRPGVAQRLRWARAIGELTRAHPLATATWDQAAAAIASADGEAASKRYRDHPIDLEPQTGLVPIGRNPATGLWEFYHLRSAWEPGTDPASVAIPQHAPDGTIEVTPATGIVFVLVPGGTFGMGAQQRARGGARFDPHAQRAEGPVHEVTLAPFFIARHEFTQAQWRRLSSGGDPSTYPVGKGVTSVLGRVTGAHPVESIYASECDALLARYELVLPTEAQWEYAALAGDDRRYPWGDELAEGHGNFLDLYAKAHTKWPEQELPWNDGHATHAPVGRFTANAFGLHDVLGNVWEFCRDPFASYQHPVEPGSGMRVPLRGDPRADWRVLRGGSYRSPEERLRPTERVFGPDNRSEVRGLRAARALL